MAYDGRGEGSEKQIQRIMESDWNESEMSLLSEQYNNCTLVQQIDENNMGTASDELVQMLDLYFNTTTEAANCMSENTASSSPTSCPWSNSLLSSPHINNLASTDTPMEQRISDRTRHDLLPGSLPSPRASDDQMGSIGAMAGGVSSSLKDTSGLQDIIGISDAEDDIRRRLESSTIPNHSSSCPPYLHPMPSGLFKELYLVADTQDRLLCIQVRIGPDPGQLVIFEPLTKKFTWLPPSSIRPAVMYVRECGDGHFKVLVAGRTTMRSDDPCPINRTEEYSSTSRAWQPCKGDLPCPPFGLCEYQNGAYFQKYSDRGYLYCTAVFDEKGSRGVVVYDFHKEKWKLERPRSSATKSSKKASSSGTVTRLITTQWVVSCGGSIILFSESESDGGVKHLLFHKLNPDTLEEKQLVPPVKVNEGAESRREYPKFACVPGSATFVECAGLVFVVSVQEPIDGHQKNDICIQRLNGGRWDEIHRSKVTRYRGPAWGAKEIDAFLKWMEQAQKAKDIKSKPPWIFISEGLERDGYTRSPDSCEDLLRTLRSQYKVVDKYLKDNKASTNVWTMTKHERSQHKLPPTFSLDWKQKMEKLKLITIKSNHNEDQEADDDLPAAALTSGSSLAQASSSAARPAVSNPASSAPTSSTLAVEDSRDGEQVMGQRPRSMTDQSLTPTYIHYWNLMNDKSRQWTNKEMVELGRQQLEAMQLELQLKTMQHDKNSAQKDCYEEPQSSVVPRKKVRRK